MPSIKEPLSFMLKSNSTIVAKKKMNHFNVIQSSTAKSMTTWHNEIQKLAERTRLGIPVTIATDPRHVSDANVGASIPTPFFSKWCSPLGFGAIGDTTLMREFGDIARQEYLSVGLRLALSPMADLATEPRWGRINGTFGEDAMISALLTKAYILGFQGDSLGRESVACMAKHFSGGGPQKDGEDAHFPYGKDQAYPGNNFDYHLIPFEKGVFPAHAAQIMPYYGVPVGQTKEDVGFGYNKEIITGMLRNKYGFDGVVCTDWALVSDSQVKPASAHGVEHLSPQERVAKIIDAGCDMFGGEDCPELIVELVETGKLKEARLDISVKRILRDKFRVGLFDNPFIEVGTFPAIGNSIHIEKGKESQRRSLVLLKNENNLLPLKKGTKVFVKGLDSQVAKQFTDVVSSPKEADYIILKLKTPFEPRNQYLLERFFHQGRLDFPDKEKTNILELIQQKQTITIMNLERPAVFPEINQASSAVIADFDSSDEILMELIFGQFRPSGKLPIELPSSMDAVKNQKEDVPYDSENP
jgi:beta-glucosidase